MNYYVIAPLCIVYTVLGGISIYGKYKNRKLHLYVKSLPVIGLTLFLLVNLILTGDNYTFNILIIAGLCGGFIGDLFLSFDTKFFLQGLASFLIGHILYITAFVYYGGIALYPVIYSILIIISLTYLAVFFKTLTKKMDMVIICAIIAYVIILNLMVMSALHMERQSGLFPFILTGAILFFISDSVLAVQLFQKEFKLNHFIILSTYYGAQLFIALGIFFR